MRRAIFQVDRGWSERECSDYNKRYIWSLICVKIKDFDLDLEIQ